MRQIVNVMIISLVLAASVVNAQSESVLKKVLEGLYLQGGLNSSSTTNSIDYDRRLGTSFGVGTRLDGGDLPLVNNVPALSDLKYNFGFQFEQFGSKWSESDQWDGGKYNNEIELRFNYLSFPLLVEYMLCNAYLIGGLKPRILVGGTESWKFKSVYYSGDMEYSDTSSGDEDIKDDMKTLDFGLVFGAGLPFSWKDHNFRVEAKYEIGLRDISDYSDSSSNGSSSSSLKNNSFLISFAWQLAL
jgi:hypothetical protein